MRFWNRAMVSAAVVAVFSLAASGCKTPAVQPTPPSAESIEALHDAAGAGDVATVRKTLDAQPGLLDARDEGGATPLITAAYARKADLVKLLLDRGADANARKRDGWSALHFAAWRGDPDIAKLLLDRGAAVDAKKPDGETPLHAAVADGHAEVVELLVEAGADVNAKKEDGWTPLRFATAQKREEIAAFLRSRGATE